MKKYTLLFFLCFTTYFLSAQLMGARLGLSQSTYTAAPILFENEGGFQSLKIQAEEFKTGINFGLIGQFQIGKFFFIQPEVLFDFNQINYQVDGIGIEGNSISRVFKETITRLDVPVSAGVKLWIFRAYLGGIARAHIDYYSDFEDEFGGYKPNYKLPNYGWHYGAGVNLSLSERFKLLVDLKHEKSLDDFGNGFEFNGENSENGENYHRYVLSIGFVF